MKTKIVALLLLCASCSALYAQNVRNLVRQTVNSELAADKADHSRWIFYEVDRKPSSFIEQWVAQTSHGDVSRIIRKNGAPIPKPQQRKAVESFIHDSDAQQQQRQSGRKDAQEAESLLKMLPDAFIWSIVKKNDMLTVFHFQPNPDFNPPGRQARVFAAMEGDMTVNNQQRRIKRLKGVLIHVVNFGWGLLGSLKKGGWFQVDREQVAPGLWQITETHVHIQGRALLFKTISEQEDDVKSHFTRQSDDVTLEQAAEAVMKQPNLPSGP
jgi:hypothetical protein